MTLLQSAKVAIRSALHSISKRSVTTPLLSYWGTDTCMMLNPPQAEAERRLLAAALLRPANQRFMLLSEACLPLYPPHVVWAEAFATRLSRVHACKRDMPEDEQRRNIDK